MIDRMTSVLKRLISAEWTSNVILMRQIKRSILVFFILGSILLGAYMKIQRQVSYKNPDVSIRDFSQVTQSQDVQALLIESMASKIQMLESQVKQLSVSEDPPLEPNPYVSHAEREQIQESRPQLGRQALSRRIMNADRVQSCELRYSHLPSCYRGKRRTNPVKMIRTNQFLGEIRERSGIVIDDGQNIEKNPRIHDETGASIHSLLQYNNAGEGLNISTENPDKDKPAKTAEKRSLVIPAGAFATAVLLGGVDAPASALNTANPLPVLLRVTDDAVLPNDTTVSLKGCFVTGAAIGDVSSENVYIRLERLSCHLSNHDLVDTAVAGSVFGPNGKNGIRGNVVWREKSLIQRAFIAGGLSGLSDLIKSQNSYTNVDGLFGRSAVPNEKVLTYAAGSGTGSAFDRLADYNIKRAEQYHPVVQVSAGIVVNIVFLKGFSLDSKHADETLNSEEVMDE